MDWLYSISSSSSYPVHWLRCLFDVCESCVLYTWLCTVYFEVHIFEVPLRRLCGLLDYRYVYTILKGINSWLYITCRLGDYAGCMVALYVPLTGCEGCILVEYYASGKGMQAVSRPYFVSLRRLYCGCVWGYAS